MGITVNTNIASLVAQKSLNHATTKMNTAMQRMTTGFRINSSSDDAAGLAVSTKMEVQIQGITVANENTQMGMSLLSTSEGILDVIQSSMQRIRDLTEQAANGTYGTDSLAGLIVEIQGRLDEVTRVSNTAEFNGIKLLDGSTKAINLQVGINNTKDDIIELDTKLFQKADASTLLSSGAVGNTIKYSYKDSTGTVINDQFTLDCSNIAEVFTARGDAAASSVARGFLDNIDAAIADLTNKKATIGCNSQRLMSTQESLAVQKQSLTEANSLIKDADIATESSEYIKSQILQQVSATMLTTANQAPSIAVNLV